MVHRAIEIVSSASSSRCLQRSGSTVYPVYDSSGVPDFGKNLDNQLLEVTPQIRGQGSGKKRVLMKWNLKASYYITWVYLASFWFHLLTHCNLENIQQPMALKLAEWTASLLKPSESLYNIVYTKYNI